MAYCDLISSDEIDEVARSCKELLAAVKLHNPALLNKPKFHLLLHLHESMRDYGQLQRLTL